jgi:hypothetical protein
VFIDEDAKAYLASVPRGRTAAVSILHEIIMGLYPDAEVTMGYKMPTYRVGAGWVAIANQKN